MWFLASCSNGGGQVPPVRTMAFRRILLSYSSCVQFKIMWLTVCSSFSPQGRVELGIILNLWRYDLVKPWPVTIAVNSAEIGIMVFILSFMHGKNIPTALCFQSCPHPSSPPPTEPQTKIHIVLWTADACRLTRTFLTWSDEFTWASCKLYYIISLKHN